jgi:hypothetical protein
MKEVKEERQERKTTDRQMKKLSERSIRSD